MIDNKGLDFYKKREGDQIWWVQSTEEVGKMWFSFDKINVYNVFTDYPDKLNKEQLELFEKENPFWVNSSRK